MSSSLPLSLPPFVCHVCRSFPPKTKKERRKEVCHRTCWRDWVIFRKCSPPSCDSTLLRILAFAGCLCHSFFEATRRWQSLVRCDFLRGLTSLPAEVFHSGPAAWPDIIRGGAVCFRVCVLMAVLTTNFVCLCVCKIDPLLMWLDLFFFSFLHLHLKCKLPLQEQRPDGRLVPVAVSGSCGLTAPRTLARLRLLRPRGRKTPVN